MVGIDHDGRSERSIGLIDRLVSRLVRAGDNGAAFTNHIFSNSDG